MIITLLHWAVSALAVLTTAYLVKGFEVKSFISALLAAAVIGIANVLVWPAVFFLTLPLTIITLGLFVFVVNGIVLKLCAAIIPGFDIKSWAAAIFGALVLSMVSAALHYLLV